MYKNVKLISKNDIDLKVDAIKSFKYAKNLNQSLITIDEFFKACRSYPIVFSKDINGNYIAITLFSLEKNKNYFVNGKGEWLKGEYIPAYVRRYPFIFVEEKGILALAYDEDCKEINKKNGQKLFNEDGSETDYLKNVLKFMEEYQNSFNKTSKFIKELEDLELLEDTNAELIIDNNKFFLTGFKKVNEDKLNSLKDEIVLKLVKNGIYKAIVAHLISLENFNKLLALKK